MLYIALVLWVVFLAFLVYRRVREDRYLKAKTKEVIDPTFRAHLDRERDLERKRLDAFQEALKRANTKN